MDKAAAWQGLAANMRLAAAAMDWSNLLQLDQKVAGELRSAASRDRFSVAERAALAALRLVHDEALAVCSREVSELASRMESMRDCKEGWQAYAASSEIEEGQP